MIVQAAPAIECKSQPKEFKRALLAAGVSEWSANALIDLQLLYRRGGANAVTRDLEEVLGRKPVAFEQFSRDYAEALRPQKRAASVLSRKYVHIVAGL